ncbi:MULTISPECIES: type II toxin-antitoxin system RelE/ParE family toxin [Edwardsiella]|uniref:Addiction module toxin RelE n=1 Tax=Edwardsiella tarda TaxID=636 RepID=A0A2A7U2P4_EDWTA|nr:MULTISPECIES: type II toxin-antitoxin system RelE/ParE family toxin [Edwardsiella]PEH72635.1 addiction module toxin RelE [Edwardsiella tarda]UCQ22549.1 type II toxin-antitoxin system RelE/ParE family toxin [Edwardsiella piscicida]
MWIVETTAAFDEWFTAQSEALQDEMLAALTVLSEFGPNLGRPIVDTLKGAKLANLKELRVQFAGNPIRAFFAFDPERKAIVLCAGDKTGINEKRFYKSMIKLAEAEFSRHLKKRGS